MGFFSDLKEDLSQAVNELMPEEVLNAEMADSAEREGAFYAGQSVQGAPVPEEEPDTVNTLDISSMLDRLDEIDTSEALVEEAGDVLEVSSEDVVGLSWTETAVAEEVSEPEEAAEESVSEVPEEEPEEAVYEEEPIPMPETEEEPETETEETENIVSQTDGEEEKAMDMQTNRVAVDETAVVTEGMTITGDIVSEGSMELIGTVNGNLDIYGKLNITGTIQGNSKAAEIYAEGANIVGEVNSDGSVKIGQSSVIIGNISATSAVIAGAVKGDIDVHGPVILDTTAIVMGNIKSKSVQINNGAVIEGLCSQCYADINPSTFFEELKKKK